MTTNIKYITLILIICFQLCSCQNININSDIDVNSIESKSSNDLSKKSNEEMSIFLNKFNKTGNAYQEKIAQDYVSRIRNVVTKKNYEIKIIIIPTDEFLSTSFPPDTIILSRSIFSKDSPCGSSSEDAVIGIIAHEMCHIIFGHTQQKWKWISAHNEILKSKIEYNIINVITTPLLIRPRINLIVSNYVPDANYSEWFFENSADLFSIKVMNALGNDPKLYFNYLEKLKENNSKCSENRSEFSSSIDNRVSVVGEYFKSISYKKKKYPVSNDLILVKIDKYGTKRKFAISDFSNRLYNNSKYDELVRSINFWRKAVEVQEDWSKEFFGMNNIPVSGMNGFIRDDDGDIFRFDSPCLPYNIKGNSSFILEGYYDEFKWEGDV